MNKKNIIAVTITVTVVSAAAAIIVEKAHINHSTTPQHKQGRVTMKSLLDDMKAATDRQLQIEKDRKEFDNIISHF